MPPEGTDCENKFEEIQLLERAKGKFLARILLLPNSLSGYRPLQRPPFHLKEEKMNMFDPQTVSQFTAVSWLVMRIITPAAGFFSIPFLIWRILRWSYGTYKQTTSVNAKIDRLIALLEAGNTTAGPALQEGSATAAAPPGDPAEEPNAESAPPEQEPAAEPEQPTPWPSLEETSAAPAASEEGSFTTDIDWGKSAEEPAAEEAAPSAEPAAEGIPAEEETAAAPPAQEEQSRQGATALPQDPGRPGVNLARCGSCGHKLSYKSNLAGKQVRCPSCKTPLHLP